MTICGRNGDDGRQVVRRAPRLALSRCLCQRGLGQEEPVRRMVHLPEATVEDAKAEVAMGHTRAHAQRLGEGEGVVVVRLGNSSVWRGARRSHRAAHASSQGRQQGLRLLEVSGVKALDEPAVDLPQELSRFSLLALVLPEPGQAHGGAQLQ